MIEDSQRGGAWTRALLGLPAREIHLCGHECAIGLVSRLASSMGEPLEVQETVCVCVCVCALCVHVCVRMWVYTYVCNSYAKFHV